MHRRSATPCRVLQQWRSPSRSSKGRGFPARGALHRGKKHERKDCKSPTHCWRRSGRFSPPPSAFALSCFGGHLPRFAGEENMSDTLVCARDIGAENANFIGIERHHVGAIAWRVADEQLSQV